MSLMGLSARYSGVELAAEGATFTNDGGDVETYEEGEFGLIFGDGEDCVVIEGSKEDLETLIARASELVAQGVSSYRE